MDRSIELLRLCKLHIQNASLFTSDDRLELIIDVEGFLKICDSVGPVDGYFHQTGATIWGTER